MQIIVKLNVPNSVRAFQTLLAFYKFFFYASFPASGFEASVDGKPIGFQDLCHRMMAQQREAVPDINKNNFGQLLR